MWYAGRHSEWARACLCGTFVLILIFASTGPAGAQETILTIERVIPQGYYLSGQTLDIAVTFNREGAAPVTALALYETLPGGWTYDSYVSGPYPVIAPAPGAAGQLQFAYLSVPGFPATFVYRVNVPFDESGTQILSGYAEYRLGGGSILTPVLETAIPRQNQPPVANADAYAVGEDAVRTVSAPGVLGNDTDPDGDALTAVLVSGVSHGALTLNANGSFSYVPAANYNGPDSFTYQASDGELDSNVATVSITVTPVNDRPVAANDLYTIAEDQTLTVAVPGVLGNDSDADGNNLTAVLLTGVSHGTLTLRSNGSFIYTPAHDYHGPDSFRYAASDQILVSLAAVVSITVTPVNDPPVSANDAYTVAEDGALTVTAPGVLGNDTDAEGDARTAVLVSGPGHGTLTLDPDGSFVYTPEANYNGADSFTYRANDGAIDGNEAAVTITVTPVNDAPVADAGDDQINALTGRTITLDGSDSYDVDGDLIVYEWRFESLPPASALTDSDIVDWDTASPSFVPAVAGDFVLSLVVRDYEFDSDPDYVMVSADAQAAPNGDAGGNQETLLGEVVVLDGCSSYDPDNGPEPLTYAWSFFSVAPGSALTDNDIVDSTLCSASFKPDAAGMYELMLTVSDGFESDIAVAVITVTELENVPPVADAGADQTVAYGATAYLDGSVSNDPDSGPQPLAFLWSFVSLPALSGLTNDDISGRTTAVPWFVPDVAGSYVLQLEVTDGEDTATDNVEVICMPGLTFQDVTGRVSMSTANERAYMTSRITRMMVSTADLTITNVSAETIEVPMHAVFIDTTPGTNHGRWQVDMPEASGRTEQGDFYYDLGEKTGITELLPGQSVTFEIKFVFHFSILHRFSEEIRVWGMAP